MVRVMETQISEIEKTPRSKNSICLDLLKTTKNRTWLLSNPELHAAVRIESSLLKGARHYFEEQGFTEIVVPHMTKATGACENIATMFRSGLFWAKKIPKPNRTTLLGGSDAIPRQSMVRGPELPGRTIS